MYRLQEWNSADRVGGEPHRMPLQRTARLPNLDLLAKRQSRWECGARPVPPRTATPREHKDEQGKEPLRRRSSGRCQRYQRRLTECA